MNDELTQQRLEFFRMHSSVYRILKHAREELTLADAQRYHDEAIEALGHGNQARHRYLAYWGDRTSLQS